MEKYIIEIKRSDSYQETDYRYEGSDGKLYSSSYGLPEGVKYKKVPYETGETKWNDRQIFRQEVEVSDVDPLWMTNVIKAVNEI